MSPIDKVQQKLETEKAARESDWTALVGKLALDERGVTDKQIVAVLEATGRTPNDLREAVANEKHCIELRERCKQRPVALKRLHAKQSAKDDYHARRQRQWHEWQAEDKRTNTELFAAQAELQEIDAAVAELERLTGETFVFTDNDSTDAK